MTILPQGIFTSGEELVMTVIPVLDFLPEVTKLFLLHKIISNLSPLSADQVLCFERDNP